MGEVGKNSLSEKMVLKASLIILVLFQALNINAAPKPDEDNYEYAYDEDYYELDEGEGFGTENICVLPKELGYSGMGMPLVDCDTVNRMKTPPCNIFSWGGNHPKICCPVAEYIDDPGDDEGDDEDDANYECTPSELGGNQDKCDANSKCVALSACGKSEFEKDKPPTPCGYTKVGEDMVCCSDTTGEKVQFSQKPLYKTNRKVAGFTREKEYPCSDHSWMCLDWGLNDPKSCEPGHPSYVFMREACPKTCNRCGKKGCVDEYAKCPEWARTGKCATQPAFMAFNCRESCGSCGFKSAHHADKVQQSRDKKEQYTVMKSFQSKPFSCGKFEEIGKDKIKKQKEVKDTIKIQGYGCSSVVISDRFVITAAHCVPAELKSGEIRQIGIRDGTQFAETVEVRRLWRDSRYDPNAKEKYYDIAVLELERRVIYDYEKYGDSPACLGTDKDLDGQVALVQGFGITEDGTPPDGILEANVTIISNSQCKQEMSKLKSKYGQEAAEALPDGPTDAVLCTKGIWNNKKSVFTGPCDGDDGGPLFINQNVNANGDIIGRTLVAINSGSIGKCGRENFPAWWTRIASYIDWLRCIQEEAATPALNAAIGEETDQTHAQIEAKCKSKLPQKI